MNRQYLIWTAVAVLIALGAGFGIGRRTTPGHATANAPVTSRETRRPLYYRNPMGLPDTSPVPKKDAMGMDYLPVYADDEAAATPGVVALAPERIQALGVRTEPVRRQSLDESLRTSGTVQVDETRQFSIAPRFDGWVERLQANQTGMAVRRGQPLLHVYSPQLLAAQEDYRVAAAALRNLEAADPSSAQAMRRLRDAAVLRLRHYGIDPGQLQHLAHLSPGNLAITAPADGVILDKPIVEGARFVAGDTILRLADLSVVWVTVNVPASQIDAVRLGQDAEFTTPALPGRRFSGRVGFLQPTLDTTTRSLGVRVVLPNPDGQLRPGLYGQVILAGADGMAVLTIPRSALIDSGTRQTVLVQVAEGRFAPRSVVIGRRSEDRIEVSSGLAEGERVVVEGNFLIDSESNLRAALANLASAAGDDGKAATDPAAASTASPALPPPQAGHAGHDSHTMPPPARARPPVAHPTPRPDRAHPPADHDMSQMEH